MNRATAPEVRLTAHVFEQIYGTPPATSHHVRGALPLLDGLNVHLPWGVVVAACHSDDASTSLYSMNHHAQGVVASSTTAGWARDCLTAWNACANPGTRLLVNRELPVRTGLLTGAETVHATALALWDLHGAAPEPSTAAPAHRLCDLSGTGLRLLLADVGVQHPATVPPADPDAAGRAAAALLAGRPADLGPLLTDAHGPGNPTHDDALETALDAGALGGRTIGACLVILASARAVPAIRERITARLATCLPRPPRYLTI